MGGDEDTLFRQVVHDDQDGGEAGGGRKLLDEIHGNGVPRTLRNGELFQEAIRLVVRYLGMGAGSTGGHVVLDEGTDSQLGIFLVH